MRQEEITKKLETMAELACEAAVKAGAEFSDAVASTERVVRVSAEKNGIKGLSEHTRDHVSVRCFIEGGMGMVSSPALQEKDVRDAAERAVTIAKMAEKDPDFSTLPSPEEHESITGRFDDALAGMSSAAAVEMVAAEIDGARSVDERILVADGELWLDVREAALANSLGLREELSGTATNMWIMTIVRGDEEVASAYEFDYARQLCDFSPEGVGAEAAKKTLKQMGAESVRTGKFPVILGPLASNSLFQSVCLCANGEDVRRQRSFLIGKKGKRIASEHVTLTDDGLIPGGMSSGAVDGEGSVRKKVEVVKDGVLASYLHSLYTSLKAKEENTGHGTRGKAVRPTNVIPKLGEKTANEIISEVERGLYVEMGGFMPDMQTGEISATVDWGFWIERGKFVFPVKNTMVAGNAIELMCKIDAISSDCRREPGAVMPTVRISEATVAGAG